MHINTDITPDSLAPKLQHLWELSAAKIRAIEEADTADSGAPVVTVEGQYTSRGWTEWTQGFQYGSAILQFEATGDEEFLKIGRDRTVAHMAPHITHTGVHDHGFNNVSTYGNLRRLMNEGKIPDNAWERHFYELALKCSGAVQAGRWTRINGGGGFIHSFNGPHSLFADTIRSLRALAMGHQLGHVLMAEQDESVSLLGRLVDHARATATYSVYYGDGRDAYDVRGRVAHESIFNTNNGVYRCPSSQQGYSPFTTWTRGLAWIILGYAEQLEFIESLSDADLEPCGGREDVKGMMEMAGLAASDFFIEHSAADGITYWDTGAPGLEGLGDWRAEPAQPVNPHEPVDSSASVISAQGLLRLGRYLQRQGSQAEGQRYVQAGLTVIDTLFDGPYLSIDSGHHGLILHSIYHNSNGWDHRPQPDMAPYGESSMWGDYHAREVALYLQRIINNEPDYTFFGPS